MHVTSDEKVWCMRALLICFIENVLTSLMNYLVFPQKEVQSWPCLWNGIQKPCYLFARKFTPETMDSLLRLLANYSGPWACYFDLILWSESNVSFGPDLGFSYGMRVVNCSIIAAWSPASHIYWVQELNWPWSSSGLTWTEEEANDLVFLLGMDGWLIIFSFHFCYILHYRFLEKSYQLIMVVHLCKTFKIV